MCWSSLCQRTEFVTDLNGDDSTPQKRSLQTAAGQTTAPGASPWNRQVDERDRIKVRRFDGG